MIRATHTMRTLAFSIFIILDTVSGVIWQPQEARTYVLVLPGQDSEFDYSTADTRYELFLTNPHDGLELTVTVTAVDGTVAELQLPPLSKRKLPLDAAHAVYGSGISNNTVKVFTDTGSCNLQVFVTKDSHIEGFTAIANEQLSGPNAIDDVYEYVITTFCETSGYCQFSVAAIEDETIISVKIPDTVPNIKFCLGERGEFNSQKDRYLLLNQSQAVQFESTSDLTGTHIYSHRPITVFSGSRGIVHGPVTAHTIEQLAPSSQWGQVFVLQDVGTSPGIHGDVYVISANWEHTLVSMTGFPTINLNAGGKTMYRRLSPGTISHVNATHTIQIVQITGLTNASDQVLRLGMTTVPAVQHRSVSVYTSCNGYGITLAVIKEKSDESVTTRIGSLSPSTSIPVPYSMYMVLQYTDMISDVSVLVSPAGILGILKCSTTAIMASTPVYTEPVDSTPTPDSPVTECIDGAAAYLLPYEAHVRSVEYEVLKLRYKSCGDVAIKFYNEKSPDGWHILFQVSYTNIIISTCDTRCTRLDLITINCATPLDCSREMNVLWYQKDVSALCYGVGAVVKDTRSCVSYPTGSINTFNVVGIGHDVTLHYDLEHLSGCSVYDSESWRCEDKDDNCGEFEADICQDVTYGPWLRTHCARTCNFCSPDSFGRQFKVVLPVTTSLVYNCLISVRAESVLTSVAAAYDGGILPQTATSPGNYFLFDCSALTTYTLTLNTFSPPDPCSPVIPPGLLFLYSDEDVSVSVYIQASTFRWQTGLANSYVVHPVDAFDYEFMSLTARQQVASSVSTCSLISASGDSSVLFRGRTGSPLGTIEDGEYFTVTDHELVTIELEDQTLINNVPLFTSSRPITLFCGRENSTTGNAIFSQVLPTAFWSTNYAIPSFDVVHQFKVSLLIQSNEAKTTVSITGSIANELSLQARGDVFQTNVSSSESLEITSDQPVAVALLIVDSLDDSKTAFFQLPPTSSFISSNNRSLPINVLETFGFNRSDVAMATSNESPERFYGIMVALSDDGEWLIVPGEFQSVRYRQPTPCSVSAVALNDGIDNDCDGTVDEGSCYQGYGVYASEVKTVERKGEKIVSVRIKQTTCLLLGTYGHTFKNINQWYNLRPQSHGTSLYDRDTDGHYRNDDCGGQVITGPTQVESPAQPLCRKTAKTKKGRNRSPDYFFPAFPDLCKINCTCPCSWMENLDFWNNLTEAEKLLTAYRRMEHILLALVINTTDLSTTKAKKISMPDKRPSAQKMGYLGLGFIVSFFACMVAIDMPSIIRDARILVSNIKAGRRRFVTWQRSLVGGRGVSGRAGGHNEM